MTYNDGILFGYRLTMKPVVSVSVQPYATALSKAQAPPKLSFSKRHLVSSQSTNPRRIFEAAALKELADSIRSQGVRW